jgi:hypothetical protein
MMNEFLWMDSGRIRQSSRPPRFKLRGKELVENQRADLPFDLADALR